MTTIRKILEDKYGVGILAASPVTVLWAAESIADATQAKRELRAANRLRERYGVIPAFPEYGTRLW